jgi:hypothetical protein
MSSLPLRWDRQSALTRISVTGSGDFYLVRTGAASPVKVWVRREGVTCECGQGDCVHIKSLELCGFLQAPCERSQAA